MGGLFLRLKMAVIPDISTTAVTIPPAQRAMFLALDETPDFAPVLGEAEGVAEPRGVGVYFISVTTAGVDATVGFGVVLDMGFGVGLQPQVVSAVQSGFLQNPW